MKKLTLDLYKKQQADCDNLCDITEKVVEEKNYMRCVRCPFCAETVDAILTKTTISCPKCETVVSR